MAVMDGPPGPSGAPMDIGPTDGGVTGGSIFSPKMLLLIGGGLIAIFLIYKWYTNNNSSNSAGVATDGTLNTNGAGSDQASTGVSNPPIFNIIVQEPAQPVATTTKTTHGGRVTKGDPSGGSKSKGGGLPANHAYHPPKNKAHTSINKNIISSDSVSAYSGKMAPSSAPTPSAGTTRSA